MCMSTFKTICIVILFMNFTGLVAQEIPVLTTKDSVLTKYWTLGLGYNIVDDTATPFGSRLFNAKETWNSVPFPSSLSIARYFKSGLETKLVASYNRYKVGKLIDGQINTTERKYYALDGMISYDINKIVGETGWFDPFIQAGAGYSDIGNLGRTTANVGFGFNTWFNDHWGLNFNTMAKYGIKKGTTRQVQHTAGIAYRFGIEKELTDQGAEKLALIEALNLRQQQVQDSIAKALILAQQLAFEKEQKRIAELRKTKEDSLAQQKLELQQQINSISNVYFDLNSSYLTPSAKNILSKLAAILKSNPTMIIEIASHTDSRGTKAYNTWLSERRVNRVIEFLEKNGVGHNQLKGKAYGEEQLVNDCDDHHICTEEKHKENRRSEFILINQ